MSAVDGTSLWYIETRPGGPGLGTIRQELRAQGIRRVEAVTDRVLRCWASRRPALPAAWRGVVVEAADAEPSISQVPEGPAPGALVRLLAGPAAGFTGRVRQVAEGYAVVDVLVWGKGLALRAPVTELALVETLPWDREASGSGHKREPKD
jgi:hypothetical protein